MNRSRRQVIEAANGMSSVDRCDGATTNTPVFGSRSRPRTRVPKSTRAIPVMTKCQNR